MARGIIKKMTKKSTLLAGKAIRFASRLRGGGSALPGLIVEKIDPHFLKHTLTSLPLGVTIISGTNGKTTTTKMVVELLESQGLRVFTNSTGSNFKRGVISSILEKVKMNGKLDYDIAVLELDEAHAVHFVREVPPSYSLLLNVMRDQLDRFGEIDTTAKMLETIATTTTKGVVLNREDRRIRAIASKLKKQTVRYFGLSEKTLSHFPSDDDLYGRTNGLNLDESAPSDVILEDFKGQTALFSHNGKYINTTLRLKGAYNIYNAAAALALVKLICGNTVDEEKLIASLSQIEPAFGRGEKLLIDGIPLELVLVKNPSGFRLGLSSFSPEDTATMIAINDNYADGRDMSWLWDVDFISLQKRGVRMVSGVRAYDMALRLQYDKVQCDFIEADLGRALKKFLVETSRPKRIFCTYTAMLTLRRELKKYTSLERVL